MKSRCKIWNIWLNRISKCWDEISPVAAASKMVNWISKCWSYDSIGSLNIVTKFHQLQQQIKWWNRDTKCGTYGWTGSLNAGTKFYQQQPYDDEITCQNLKLLLNRNSKCENELQPSYNYSYWNTKSMFSTKYLIIYL